jgi:hypothetical protein
MKLWLYEKMVGNLDKIKLVITNLRKKFLFEIKTNPNSKTFIPLL